MIFSENDYIEENASGLIYVGVTANQAAHIIRKTGVDLATFKKAYNKVLKVTIQELKKQ